MPEQYDAAAKRHFADAERLAGASQYDNAGHLIGFATECALKHHFGVTANAPSPRTHLPDLAKTMRKRLEARDPRQAAMRSMLDMYAGSFFDGWDVNSRYSSNGAITEQIYIKWRDQTRRTLGAAGLLDAKGDQ